MSANIEAKKAVVAEIKEKLSNAKSVTFVNYNGLTVDQDTKMRREFRNAGSEYKVYKNKLIAIALNELGITGCEKYLEGTTAVAFGFEDEVSQAKVACESADKNKKISIKFGIISGKVVSNEEIKALATLPSKEILIAKLLGCLNAPITGLASVLSAPTRGLAIALNAIAQK